jgi:peptidoglycan/LPS O-acetylase OafA/YrhL
MLMMFATSLAAIGFFRRGADSGETAWQRLWAPAIGAAVLLAVLLITVANLDQLLGTEPGSPLSWIPLGVVVVAVVAGLVWGRIVRSGRPDIYQNIGAGEPEPLAVLEHALADIKV